MGVREISGCTFALRRGGSLTAFYPMVRGSNPALTIVEKSKETELKIRITFQLVPLVFGSSVVLSQPTLKKQPSHASFRSSSRLRGPTPGRRQLLLFEVGCDQATKDPAINDSANLFEV